MLGNIADWWLLNYFSINPFMIWNRVTSHKVQGNFLFKNLGARNLQGIDLEDIDPRANPLTIGHPPYCSDRTTGKEETILVDSDLHKIFNSVRI